jgi:uncharacterized protein (DUF2141 family)
VISNLCKLISASLFTLHSTAWILSGAHLAAQAPQTATLTVRSAGCGKANGNLRVALRRDENTIVEGRTVDVDPRTLTAQVVFEKVPAGVYDVAVIHDENKNGKLDFSEMAMPIEGYGHSNNPGKRQGPPPFGETKFTLAAPSTSIAIELIYWP